MPLPFLPRIPTERKPVPRIWMLLGLVGCAAAIVACVMIIVAWLYSSQHDETDVVRRRGRQRMKREKAVFCGIARDNSKHLWKTLCLIDRMGAMFESYKVIIYENDSQDVTCAILDAWQAQHGAEKVQVIHERLAWPPAISNGGFSTRRFEVLSYCRNKYVERLCRDDEYADHAYVVVLDMDLWDFDPSGLAHSFGQDVEWSSISANGVFDGRTYYDALAFRSPEFPDTLHSEAQRNQAQRVYHTSAPLVPVTCAFGGLAIYKRACMVRCRYTGNDCEHVGMYACQSGIKGCNKHWMNPAMKLRYHFD